MRLRTAVLALSAVAGVLVLLILIYLGVLLHLHDYNPDFLAIDGCLDAGGYWDYSTRECIGRRTPSPANR